MKFFKNTKYALNWQYWVSISVLPLYLLTKGEGLVTVLSSLVFILVVGVIVKKFGYPSWLRKKIV